MPVSNPSAKPARTTPFQARVYAAVALIPPGRVSTYGAVAHYLGCRSARAVGQALRRNPFAPKIPCHRVIAANLTPGGFNGTTDLAQLQRKIALLREENVHFRREKLAEPARLFNFPQKEG